MKKCFLIFIIAMFILNLDVTAKIWRVNNNVLIDADVLNPQTLFNGVNSANDPEAANGDTIHIEPSSTDYSSPTINKQVVIIGNGYFLGGTGSNSNLQENILTSRINGFTFANGSAGTRIIGMDIIGNSAFSNGYSGNVNITFEKCKFGLSSFINFSGSAMTYSNITFRKCFLEGQNPSISSTATIENFTIENCIFIGNVFYFKPLLGSNIIIRNNTFRQTNNTSTFLDINKAYFANNIVITFINTNTNTFSDCNIKNNIFFNNQSGVTVGPFNVNGNNLTNVTPVGSIILDTGSNDGKYQLAAASPAIGGGVDIGGVKPDCGAYGGNDPYKLSGIPGIPTIYGLTAPVSIPFGQATMNVTISTRNNN